MAEESGRIEVTVNGEARPVPAGCTVSGLLALMQIDAVRVAVERNLDVVPRRAHEATVLADGDRLEVVTFVGGGA